MPEEMLMMQAALMRRPIAKTVWNSSAALLGVLALGTLASGLAVGPANLFAQEKTSNLVCQARNLTVSLAINPIRSVATMGNAQVKARITETQFQMQFSTQQSGIPGGVEYQINRLTGDFVARFLSSGEVWTGTCRPASRL